jgi:hypothetical protein
MFHTNPFAYNWTEVWDMNETDAKELILKNNRASKLGVSEMFLNITKFSAFDEHGNEHFIKDFPKQAELNPKGMHTEFFIKVRSKLALDNGNYKSFRFYLSNSGNRLMFNDRSSETISHLDYLDFEIKNGLLIKGDEDRTVVFRFDFEPYTLASYFKPLLKLFNRSRRYTGKLAGSFGN